MEQRPERRFSRLAVGLVALATLGTSAFVVNLALRSSKKVESAQQPVGNRTVEASADSFVSCTNCHKDLDKVFKQGRAPGLLYRHEKHFAKGVSDCGVCHSATTHEADKINKPTMTRCFMCHGLTSKAIAPGKCSTCHPANFPDRPVSHQDRDNWLKVHGQTAKTDAFQCAACHEQQKFCNACHGTTMPHAQGWKDLPHAETFFKSNGLVCLRCHERGPQVTDGRDFCDRCHHPWGDQKQPWRRVHPTIVKTQGASDCFRCHNPVTCATCHVGGKEDFSSDRVNLSPSPSPSPSSSQPGSG